MLNKIYETIEDCLQVPKFDGTESIYQIRGNTLFEDNIMKGGCAYLENGFDNSNDWILTADINIGNNSGIAIFPPNSTAREVDEFLIIWIRIYSYVNRVSRYSSDFNTIMNNWKSIKVTKQDTTLTLSFDNVTRSINWSIVNNYSELHLGVDNWGEGYSQIRNVKIKPL